MEISSKDFFYNKDEAKKEYQGTLQIDRQVKVEIEPGLYTEDLELYAFMLSKYFWSYGIGLKLKDRRTIGLDTYYEVEKALTDEIYKYLLENKEQNQLFSDRSPKTVAKIRSVIQQHIIKDTDFM